MKRYRLTLTMDEQDVFAVECWAQNAEDAGKFGNTFLLGGAGGGPDSFQFNESCHIKVERATRSVPTSHGHKICVPKE